MVKRCTPRVLMLTCFVAQVATSLASSTAHTQVLIGFPIFCLTDGVSVSCTALPVDCSENLIQSEG